MRSVATLSSIIFLLSFMMMFCKSRKVFYSISSYRMRSLFLYDSKKSVNKIVIITQPPRCKIGKFPNHGKIKTQNVQNNEKVHHSTPKRRLQRRNSLLRANHSILPARQPNGLRHSPTWATGSSFQTHMSRRREANIAQDTEDQHTLEIINSNKKKQSWSTVAMLNHNEPSVQVKVSKNQLKEKYVENYFNEQFLETQPEILTQQSETKPWTKIRGSYYRDIIPNPPPESTIPKRPSKFATIIQNVKDAVRTKKEDTLETSGMLDEHAESNTFDIKALDAESPLSLQGQPYTTHHKSLLKEKTQHRLGSSSQLEREVAPEKTTTTTGHQHQKQQAGSDSELKFLQQSISTNLQLVEKKNSQKLKKSEGKKIESVERPYASNLYYSKISKNELHDLDVAHRLDDEIVQMQFPILDSVTPDPGLPNIAASTGQLISSSPSSSSPEFLQWAAPVNIEKFLPSPSTRNRAFVRYRAPSDRFFQSKTNDIIYDNWWVSWSRAATSRTTSALVANQFGFFSGGIGLRDGITDFSTGWKDLLLTEYSNRANQEKSFGVAKGRYGVFVDHSNLSRASAVEILARNLASSTLVDFVDRDYGQRISIRNLDLSFRHDFDEFINPDPDEYATEILIAYRNVGVALSTDIGDSRYGIAVGVRGRQVALLHDFDERISEITLNWGRGWQASWESDFVDPFSQEVYSRLGFGRLGRAYFAIGAGVGNDGIPEGSFEAQTPDIGLFATFLDIKGNRQLQTAITIGKFTYIWESVVAPHNLRIPNFFGLDPDQVKHFLLGTQSSINY